jgi:hypothetical protein
MTLKNIKTHLDTLNRLHDSLNNGGIDTDEYYKLIDTLPDELKQEVIAISDIDPGWIIATADYSA